MLNDVMLRFVAPYKLAGLADFVNYKATTKL